MTIKDYACIGGPLDGQWLAIDRDASPIFAADAPEITPTVTTYTFKKDRITGEWYLVWDGYSKDSP